LLVLQEQLAHFVAGCRGFFGRNRAPLFQTELPVLLGAPVRACGFAFLGLVLQHSFAQ